MIAKVLNQKMGNLGPIYLLRHKNKRSHAGQTYLGKAGAYDRVNWILGICGERIGFSPKNYPARPIFWFSEIEK